MELQTGDVDEFGHVRLGGIGNRLQAEIEQRTGYEARMTQLGHLLRGGSPTAYDRVIATRFGVEAIDAVHERDFDVMVALRGTDVVRVPLEAGVAELEDRRPAPLRHRRRVLRLTSAIRTRTSAVARAMRAAVVAVSSLAAVGAALDDLIDLLELEQLEVNLFRGLEPRRGPPAGVRRPGRRRRR